MPSTQVPGVRLTPSSMPRSSRLAALVIVIGLVSAALWTLRSPRDADQDGVADASDQCPDTPTDLTAAADGCAAAQRALQRGIDALARAAAAENVGTVWAAQQVARRISDRHLVDFVDRTVEHVRGQPGARLISPGAPWVALPDDPGQGLLRLNTYILAPAGAPPERAVAFIADFVSSAASGFALTHQLLVLLWAEQMGVALPAALRAYQPVLLARMQAEQRAAPGRFSDLYAERVALLLAFGAPARAEAAGWIEVIVGAQEPDGRWVNREPSSVTYDGQTAAAMHEWTHTSAFSLLALASFLDRREAAR